MPAHTQARLQGWVLRSSWICTRSKQSKACDLDLWFGLSPIWFYLSVYTPFQSVSHLNKIDFASLKIWPGQVRSRVLNSSPHQVTWFRSQEIWLFWTSKRQERFAAPIASSRKVTSAFRTPHWKDRWGPGLVTPAETHGVFFEFRQELGVFRSSPS